MDFAQVTDLIRGQGPVFWAAAAAVALGGTLLVVSGTWYVGRLVRRMRQARSANKDHPTTKNAGSALTGVPAAGIDPLTAYGTAGASTAPVADLASRQALEAILGNLQSTAERIEALSEVLSNPNPPVWESPLKEATTDVEYIFRKGLA